ncbi:MAG TPA: 50S ribosomal protein L1 [Firmicutes bacterium]|nr:50S ribosomal protein L1 [Bacillota bacterium]
MAKKRSKGYRAAAAQVVVGKPYTVAEAATLVKKTSPVKFDASVDLAFKLNLDTKQADQQLRGTITLPHGNGKTKKILALTRSKQEEAKAAGADFVGDVDMLEKIQKENWFGFDVIVATPDMMGQIGRLGRVLGPKGLMPNPKTGTVTPNIGQAVKEIKAGKVEYRTDKDGNVQLSVGKVSFSEQFLADNINAVISLIQSVKPLSVKGVYIHSIHVSSTMGPSVKIAVSTK